MQAPTYIYFYNYDATENDLCKLESRYLFEKEEKDKLLFSSIKAEPSWSAFIKNRLEIRLSSHDYITLIDQIKEENISQEGFKVEYMVANGDATAYPERLSKLKDVGYSINGMPDYYHPTITYGICYHAGIWYFGNLVKNNFEWLKHKQKPHSYSISIGISLAKALVNIAGKSNKESRILDACCGVGTILLEACFAGKRIEGCDINWKVCNAARKNLAHFNYEAEVFHSDIKDITTQYEAAIIDLPYNLFSTSSDAEMVHIIESTAALTDRLVIISTSDIGAIIEQAGFILTDYCRVSKKGKATFARKVWVCQKRNTLEIN